MSQLSLADRLISILRLADDARTEAACLGESVGTSPRFELEMAIGEHMNALHEAFGTAYNNIERLRSVARALREKGSTHAD